MRTMPPIDHNAIKGEELSSSSYLLTRSKAAFAFATVSAINHAEALTIPVPRYVIDLPAAAHSLRRYSRHPSKPELPGAGLLLEQTLLLITSKGKKGRR